MFNNLRKLFLPQSSEKTLQLERQMITRPNQRPQTNQMRHDRTETNCEKGIIFIFNGQNDQVMTDCQENTYVNQPYVINT